MGSSPGVGGRKPPLTRLGFSFADDALERAFRQDYDKRVALQVRLSLLCGAVLYPSLAWQDVWFFPDRYPLIWLIRGSVAAMLLLTLALVCRPRFFRYYTPLVMAAALVAGAGVITMIGLGSADVASSYYLGLTLVIVWGYTFSGLRLPWAVALNLILLAAYLLVSLLVGNAAPMWLATNFGNAVAASALVGVAAYLMERQRRTVFYHALLLDDERRSHEQRAHSDHLTGLPNRAYFERHSKQALSRAQRQGSRLAVIYIDIDGFKPINDRYGHHVGDAVLAEVARRLESTLRASDIVARVGGDEFVALLEEVGDRDKVLMVVDKLREAVRQPVAVRLPSGAQAVIEVTVSVGTVLYPDDGETFGLLLEQADAAMYRDKLARLRWERETAPSD